MKIKNGFVFTAILFLGISSLHAQTISVTPDSGSVGNYLTVTITGTDVTFGQASSCLCPTCVDVSYSNVYFQQGSSTIYPDGSWTLNSNSFSADFILSGYYPGGAYDVIVGGYSSCPIICENCFTINVPPPPVNDVCSNAIEVFCGNSTNGSTTGATLDNPDYCFTSIGAPGVWYLFKGTGGEITASTCNFSGYDIKINVYKGMCDAMICVAGNDDYCGSGSSVTWNSQAGTDYFILIQGYSGDIGDFQLDLNCITCPAPVNLFTSDVTDTGATFNWTSAGSGNQWNIEYGPVGFVSGNGNIIRRVSSTPYPVSGLSISTYYDFYVQEVCNDSDSSNFTGPYTFVTSGSNPIITMSPASAVQGEYLDVTISGINITFGQASSCLCPTCVEVGYSNVFLRQGLSTFYLNYPYITGPTSLSSYIYLSTSYPTGLYDLVLGDGTACQTICNGCFTLNPAPNPRIEVSPAGVIKGDEMTVTITGTDITFGQGSSCLCPECINVTTSNVVFQQASSTILYPNSINLVNETQFTANFTLGGNIPTGFYDVIVRDSLYYNCRVSCLGCVEVLCYTLMAPVISINGDTVFCEGDSVELISSSSSGNLWSDGSTQQSVTATNSGIYFVEQINDAGCPNSTSGEVKVVVNLLPGTPDIIRADDNLVASISGVSYEWKKDGLILTDTTQVVVSSGNGVYIVRVKDANGCYSEFSSPFLMVNMEENGLKDKISIGPNPSQGIFYISLEGNRNSKIEVIVENLMGQTLSIGPLGRFEEKDIITMDLSNLPKGIYFMTIKTSSAMKNYKLLLE